jgi:hypothetical protein
MGENSPDLVTLFLNDPVPTARKSHWRLYLKKKFTRCNNGHWVGLVSKRQWKKS